MRVMLRVQMDTAATNQVIKSGAMMDQMKRTLEQLKPEATYFSLLDGQRCAYFIVDLDDPQDMPSIAEPLFMGMNAKIDMFPAMTPDELAAGIDRAMPAMR